MYASWKLENWETPISHTGSGFRGAMLSLIDDGPLKITIDIGRHPEKSLVYQIEFQSCAGYRNILEEYRIGLWEHLDSKYPELGNTFIVVNSPWLKDLRENQCLLDVHSTGAKHFVIVTGDDVVEVLSNQTPSVQSQGTEMNDDSKKRGITM